MSAQPSANGQAMTDMSALQGISPEQLAAIARLFQSGTLQMPPTATNVPEQPSMSATPSALANQPTIMSAKPLHSSIARRSSPGVDTDMEEGEVNDAEEDGAPDMARDNIQAAASRKRSVTPRIKPASSSRKGAPVQRAVNGAPAAGQDIAPTTQVKPAVSPSDSDRAAVHHEGAKLFVRELVRAGYSYAELKREMKDPKPLLRMFSELGIPTEEVTTQVRPTQPSTPAPSHALPGLPRPVFKAKTEGQTAPAVNQAVVSKPAVKDRSEYLARLKAARTKQTDTALTAQDRGNDTQPTQQAEVTSDANHLTSNDRASATLSTAPLLHTVPPAIATGSMSSKAQKPVALAEMKGSNNPQVQAVSSGRSALQTQIIRERLEALKAKQATKTAGEQRSDSVAHPSTTRLSGSEARRINGLTAVASSSLSGLPEQPQTKVVSPSAKLVASSVAQSPSGQTPARVFSGLPGLFMSDHAAQQQKTTMHTAAPHQSAAQPKPPVSSQQTVPDLASATFMAQPSIARKRAVASDLNDASTIPAVMKRPFGQSRHGSEDEALVIQVSDDEDEDEDGVDEQGDQRMDAWSSPAMPSGIRPPTKSLRDVGPLRDFPIKPSFQTQASTPGTPGGVTYEQKLREIGEIKRQIAERERNKKTNGMMSHPAVPDLEEVAHSAPDQSMQHTETLQNDLTSSPLGPVTPSQPTGRDPVSKKAEKELLQKRLLELSLSLEKHGQSTNGTSKTALADDVIPADLNGTKLAASTTTEVTLAEATDRHQSPRPPQPDMYRAELSDGELSDDSVSRFYELEKGHDQILESDPLDHEDEMDLDSATSEDPSEAERYEVADVVIAARPGAAQSAGMTDVDVDSPNEQQDVVSGSEAPISWPMQSSRIKESPDDSMDVDDSGDNSEEDDHDETSTEHEEDAVESTFASKEVKANTINQRTQDATSKPESAEADVDAIARETASSADAGSTGHEGTVITTDSIGTELAASNNQQFPVSGQVRTAPPITLA